MAMIGTGNDAPNGEPRTTPDLRAELTEIGVILDLPSQRTTRVTASVEAVVPPPISGAKLRGYLATFTIAVGFVIGVLSLRRPAAPYIPDALLGEWITSNPRYEGRQLAFTETSIELGFVKDAPRLRYPISSLSTRKLADTTVISLVYEEDGAPVELHARIISIGAPKLVFNRPHDLIWVRRTY